MQIYTKSVTRNFIKLQIDWEYLNVVKAMPIKRKPMNLDALKAKNKPQKN